MSQHHYHAVLIQVRAIHLNSNQVGCDSSLAAAAPAIRPVPTVNTTSSVFSRPQMATRCRNLPLKTSSDYNRDALSLCMCLCLSCCMTCLRAELCAVVSSDRLGLRAYLMFANLYSLSLIMCQRFTDEGGCFILCNIISGHNLPL